MGRSRCGVPLGQHVEQRVGQVGEPGGGLGRRCCSHSCGQRERHRRDIGGVERQQSLRGRRRARHRGVHQRQRGLLGRESGWPRPTSPATTARCGLRPSVGPVCRPATPGRPAAAARGPARGRPAGPPVPVCGHRFQRRRPSPPSAPACTAAAIDAVTRPLGADPAAQEGLQRRQVGDQAAGRPPPRHRRSGRARRSAAASRPGPAVW